MSASIIHNLNTKSAFIKIMFPRLAMSLCLSRVATVICVCASKSARDTDGVVGMDNG